MGYYGQRPNFSNFPSLYLDGDINAVDFWTTVSITYIKTKDIMGWLNALMNTLKVVNIVFQDILNRERRF